MIIINQNITSNFFLFFLLPFYAKREARSTTLLKILIKVFSLPRPNIQSVTDIYYPKSLDIKVRDTNKRTNLGKMYFDKIYTAIASIVKVKIISLTK